MNEVGTSNAHDAPSLKLYVSYLQVRNIIASQSCFESYKV